MKDVLANNSSKNDVWIILKNSDAILDTLFVCASYSGLGLT